jgi:hypothetical protein
MAASPPPRPVSGELFIRPIPQDFHCPATILRCATPSVSATRPNPAIGATCPAEEMKIGAIGVVEFLEDRWEVVEIVGRSQRDDHSCKIGAAQTFVSHAEKFLTIVSGFFGLFERGVASPGPLSLSRITPQCRRASVHQRAKRLHGRLHRHTSG